MKSFFNSKAGDAEKAFAAFDTDRDGHLTVDELVAAAERARGKAPVRARIEALLPRFDKNGNGKLELSEFNELIAYLERGHNVQDELANAWGTVESQREENARLRARLAALEHGGTATPAGHTPPKQPAPAPRQAAAPAPVHAELSRSTLSVVSAAIAQAQAAAASGGQTDAAGTGDLSGPPGYLVSGAGSKEVNGFYERDGEYQGAPLFKNGQWWLLRYKLPSGRAWWYIADKDNLDSNDGDMYRVRCEARLPPTDLEWLKAQDGVLPAPTLRAQERELEDGMWRRMAKLGAATVAWLATTASSSHTFI